MSLNATEELSLEGKDKTDGLPPQNRCEVDPVEPMSGSCSANVARDDRQGVSHFFGRNKTATSSIDEDLFPLLCRNHYQEKLYRFSTGKFAGFQCDCILKTIENMSHKTFVDLNGISWSWWCGFELQLKKQSEELEEPIKKNRDQVHGKSTPNLSTPTSNIPTHNQTSNISNRSSSSVPPWLINLCTKTSSETYPAITGQRHPVRYSFSQLMIIVKVIKTHCVTNDVKLPPIEALPVTIGMICATEVEGKKKALRLVMKRKRSAEKVVRTLQSWIEKSTSGTRITKGGRKAERVKLRESEFLEAKQALECARIDMRVCEKELEDAVVDLENTEMTIPKKRFKRAVVVLKEEREG